NKELGIKCYYNLWLRHYNDENADPQLSYPMEYAIVRNNIYRVALSFSGPGDPTPTMREPDTMQARIFV
ncbi:MAG: fimbria major subunit, partial [Muribaculaceae bacterium]|nr:fimbria major subunit [Muribaculaceae bacterium]